MEPIVRIVGVAVKTNDGLIHSLPSPYRHHHLLQSPSVRAHTRGGINGKPVEGFLTSEGQFVEREPAMQIARAAGQVTKRSSDPKHYQGPDLYSEDLW